MPRAFTSALLAWSLLSLPAAAALKLPHVFSDHMVLQRDLPLPVWGAAAASDKVTVTFAGQEKSATADDKGKWSLKLDPVKTSDAPQTLTIAVGAESVKIQDVLVGDVWVGSGQSNMDMNAKDYVKNDAPLAANVAGGPYPKIRVIAPGGKWRESTPENLTNFSALLLSFGLPLQKEIGVPVGLMVGAVGGTPSGAWLTPEMLEADAACQAQIAKAMAAYKPDEEKAKYDAALAAYKEAAAAAKAAGKGAPPGHPELKGKPGSFISGATIGYLYTSQVKPYVPFAIKGVVWDQGESGTALRDVEQYAVMGALIRGWRAEWGQGDFPFLHIQKPSGEGCAFDPADPVTRAASKFTPLPPVAALTSGTYRDTHVRIGSTYPSTFLVVASDLGGGIHPAMKSSYGIRAARVALGAVYGKPIEYCGPLYKSHTVDGDKVRVTFSHVGRGLTPRHVDQVQGFMLAGEDRAWQWATATIDGDAVVLRSDKVKAPVAARYAWSDRVPWANLFNKDGLPAQCFRTDDW